VPSGHAEDRLEAVVTVAFGLVFWGVHRLEREAFDRGTEFGGLCSRVAHEPLPVRRLALSRRADRLQRAGQG
jgi:hypothetical protein